MNNSTKLVSSIASRAESFVYRDKPSDLVPFKGEFPIVPIWRREEFHKTVRSTMWINECPSWIQKALLQGDEICRIHEGFESWLDETGIGEKGFKKMSAADKSTELIRYLNANSLGLEHLNIG